jgi:dCMP deaminase
MNMAEAIAEASKCDRMKVGALLVDKLGRVKSAGYNGKPHKTTCDHICLRDGLAAGASQEIRCCEHAETNCLLFADSKDCVEGTLYCTVQPCTGCANFVLQSGISRLVYKHNPDYPSDGIFHMKRLIGNDWNRLRIDKLEVTREVKK